MSHSALPDAPPAPAPAPMPAFAQDVARINWPAVRLWLYGVVIAAQPLVISYGYVTGSQATLWADALAAVLGVSSSAVAIANVNRA